MSLCVLGMAEEFRADGIAVNALWPRTAIDTDAISLITGEETRRTRTRRVEIVADAACIILTRPSREAHRTLPDRRRGAARGRCDRSLAYLQSGVREADLMPDFFV